MRRTHQLALTLVAVMAVSLSVSPAPTRAAEPQTSEYQGSGRWSVIPSNAATQPVTVDNELVRIEEIIKAGRYTDARKRLVRWFRDQPKSPVHDRALYLMAEALFNYGDRIRAFYYLDELLDEHPDSPLFNQTLQRQYDIAEAYLTGYKRRIFGIPLLGAQEEAVEILFRIQQRVPGSQLAEKCLLRTADFYYSDAQYDLAADVYGVYAKSYPRSPELENVKRRQAFANIAQFRGLRFDATPYIDARAQLTDYQANFPKSAGDYNVPDTVKRIDRAFAKKIYVTADFYRRTGQPGAAVYTYRTLIDAFPDSAEARDAKEALAKMPEKVLSEPMPGRSMLLQPTSKPTEE